MYLIQHNQTAFIHPHSTKAETAVINVGYAKAN